MPAPLISAGYENPINPLPILSSLNVPFEIDFDLMETFEERIWPFWQPSLDVAFETPLIEISLSGSLGQYSWKSKHPLLSASVDSFSPPIYANFDVRMDALTGKIFWYALSSKLVEKKVELILEEILKSLQFNISEEWDVIAGTVHFVISPDIITPYIRKSDNHVSNNF